MSTNPYKVEWTIDIEAEGPKAAAEEAHLCQLEHPPFFRVTNQVTGAVFEVDLDVEETGDPTPLTLTSDLYWEQYQEHLKVIESAKNAINDLKKRYIETLPIKVGDKVNVTALSWRKVETSEVLYVDKIALFHDIEPEYLFLKLKKDGSSSKVHKACYGITNVEKI